MFRRVFPDVILMFSFSKESLITAAEKHKPGAAALHSRLLERLPCENHSAGKFFG